MKTRTWDVVMAHRRYIDGATVAEIAKQVGRSNMSVYEALKQCNCKFRTVGKQTIRSAQALHFSKLDSEEAAYWLGMLMADGHLAGKQRRDGTHVYQLVLVLTKKDTKHAAKFHAFTGGNIGVRKNYVRVQSQCSPDWKWLLNYGFQKGKTERLRWPAIKYLRHFIRGFFDGDGWVTSQQGIDRSGRTTKKYYGTAGWISVSNSFLSSLQTWLAQHDIPAILTMHQKIGSSGNIKGKQFTRKIATYKLVIRQVDAFEKLYKLMYDHSSISLTRKRKRFEQILQRRANG